MKFLCDVHISVKISKAIEVLGYKCEHVNRILKKWNTTDEEIIEYVNNNNYILITKDQDFRNSFLLNSKPKKLIKIDLGNISNEKLLTIIKNSFQTIDKVENEFSIFMIEVSETTLNLIVKK